MVLPTSTRSMLVISATLRTLLPGPMVVLLAACGDPPRSPDTQPERQGASVAAKPTDSVVAVVPDTLIVSHTTVAAVAPRPDTAVRPDSARPRRDTTPVDPAKRMVTRGRFKISAADSARWPVPGPTPRAGALLPQHRIIAYYGNPLSKRMGILGQIPPEEMLAKLERTAAEWQKADSTTTALPALHLIVTVAQEKPGRDGKYRLRMTDSLIERVAGWAERKGWLLFLDVQTGQSTVEAELPRLAPFLARPYVHLALDPEFAMKGGKRPGRYIGTMDAAEVNHAIRFLAGIVEQHDLPPKVLVVHRFTQRMLTNHRDIRLDPAVQVVIDMDGFGAPYLKRDAYRFFIVPEPVQYAGFKLFYKNDKPLMSPDDVLDLWPVPAYIQYQ